MTDKVLVLFEMKEVRPDDREFRQNSTLFVPQGVKVQIGVPRENDYVANLSEISLKELSGEAAPEPILTVKGSVYVLQQFEEAYKSLKSVTLTAKAEEWSDVVETEKKLNAEDDWTETPFKGAESETWDDEKESW